MSYVACSSWPFCRTFPTHAARQATCPTGVPTGHCGDPLSLEKRTEWVLPVQPQAELRKCFAAGAPLGIAGLESPAHRDALFRSS